MFWGGCLCKLLFLLDPFSVWSFRDLIPDEIFSLSLFISPHPFNVLMAAQIDNSGNTSIWGCSKNIHPYCWVVVGQQEQTPRRGLLDAGFRSLLGYACLILRRPRGGLQDQLVK
tara:strand:+ start:708 stop:1049 length:342 start_codon:yes stop_codon:yes gene_type:complete